jgi:hypothetical protein
MELASLNLSIDVDSDPISGSLGAGGEEPTQFCGWIELVEAIELARHPESRAPGVGERTVSLGEGPAKD